MTKSMLFHPFNAPSYLELFFFSVLSFRDKKVNPVWKSSVFSRSCKHLCVSAEGSAYEESICNEDSVCGSDSTFYRQTEGARFIKHSLMLVCAVQFHAIVFFSPKYEIINIMTPCGENVAITVIHF